jgi:hypothetical protein
MLFPTSALSAQAPGPSQGAGHVAFYSFTRVVMCVLAGSALIASYFTKGYSLEQEHTTQQGYHERERTGVDLESSTVIATGVDGTAAEKTQSRLEPH